MLKPLLQFRFLFWGSEEMKMETRLAQLGNQKDKRTGAVSIPIYHATTFAHPGLGESTGFDYTRTANPTRMILEQEIAGLEHGTRGFAFASGMAAVHCVLSLFQKGDHLILSSDLYGGTYRLIEQIFAKYEITSTYVDTGDIEQVKAAFRTNTRALFVETPTNPTMKITDIEQISDVAKEHNCLLLVDNTFMTPYLQQPLELGADIVIHSATKYLGGHNDVLAGLVVVRDETLGEKLFFLQNSIGAILGPQDCWLLLRGMKTLALRMDRHQINAEHCAKWLHQSKWVTNVYYPGLDHHPRREIQRRQSSGFGGMISFEVINEQMVAPLLKAVQLVTFAESLGGIETLITYPARQTHFDIPEEVRIASGVTNQLLRLSVGIEAVEDIIADLSQAIEWAAYECKRG